MGEKLGLEPPKGILLYGPPGTGKTLLAKAVAASTSASIVIINASDILGNSNATPPETQLQEIWHQAERKSPCLIFLDELDLIASKRGGDSNSFNQGSSGINDRVVGTLLILMDGLASKQRQTQLHHESDELNSNFKAEPPRILVLAATNRPESIDPALRRPGRFDREIEIGIPTAIARLSILQTALIKIPHDLTPSQIQEVAQGTHGYVGADLIMIIREAGLKCIWREKLVKETSPASFMLSTNLIITWLDIEEAMKLVRPSAMREIMLEIPKVYWSDIGGQEEVKKRLSESVEWPIKVNKNSISP